MLLPLTDVPTWLALLTLTNRGPSSQADIADSMGLRAATVSHHLSGMEAAGLITRVRLPDNRRVHEVRMTEAGEQLFQTLATAARAHDRRLHANLDEDDTARLRALLDQVRGNVSAPAQAQPAIPSAGSRNQARHTVRP